MVQWPEFITMKAESRSLVSKLYFQQQSNTEGRIIHQRWFKGDRFERPDDTRTWIFVARLEVVVVGSFYCPWIWTRNQKMLTTVRCRFPEIDVVRPKYHRLKEKQWNFEGAALHSAVLSTVGLAPSCPVLDSLVLIIKNCRLCPCESAAQCSLSGEWKQPKSWSSTPSNGPNPINIAASFVGGCAGQVGGCSVAPLL